MRPITRREAMAAAAATLLAGCGGTSPTPARSTLHSTWIDPAGDGQLQVGEGESLLDRTELGRREPPEALLATLAHITDAHVLDASSPARVPFLDRLGPPFQSTFRPNEALTAQVLAGAVAAIRAARPQLVIQGGDLIDNAQHNELALALDVLRGGPARPGSGRKGYFGVQSGSDPDPFYYRPDVDAPRYPGLLRKAASPFFSRGLAAATLPVLGDHDVLVAGEVVPTPLTRSLAVGDRALWDLPPGLTLPPGAREAAASSPDGPPAPGLVDTFLHQALAGPTISVPPDPNRRELALPEAVASLRAGGTRSPDRLDYAVDAGRRLRLIVLDLVRREGGSGGLVDPAQPAWLAGRLETAGKRWVIVVTHQPIESSEGGEQLLSVLDHAPRVIAALSGHTHRNRIEPRPTAAGGYWLITTASLIDYPQQARAIALHQTRGGGIALTTWMLDHAFPGELGTIARQLSYLDAQGGRPGGFAGTRLDRNVTLYRRAPE